MAEPPPPRAKTTLKIIPGGAWALIIPWGTRVAQWWEHCTRLPSGSTPGVHAICGLSLLLVLSLAPRGFSLGTPVFPSPYKPTLSNSNLIWNAGTRPSYELLCFVSKQAIFYTIFYAITKWVYEPARTSADQFTTAKTAWLPMRDFSHEIFVLSLTVLGSIYRKSSIYVSSLIKS